MTVFLGPAAGQSSKPGLSPCALLTKAEVQEAAGSPVSEGVLVADKKGCEFKVGDTGAISITLAAKRTGDTAESQVAEFKRMKMSAEVTPGFGDGAYAFGSDPGIHALNAFKGSRLAVVTVILMGEPNAKVRTVAQSLMRKALARMP